MASIRVRIFALPCLLAALMLAPIASAADSGAAAYAAVDPFLGTGGDGHTFPGATLPFGMVQLSPDTRIANFHQSYKWAAGYRYEDSTIRGFSQTHFSGTGHSDLGDFLMMPIGGTVQLDPGSTDEPDSGYRSRFSHATEKAEPGYYAVTLDDYGIRVELTATQRVGVHRYAFPADKPAHVLLDLRSSIYNYPGKVSWASVRIRADGTVTGYRVTRGWAPGRQLYFALRFSQPLAGHALYDRGDDVPYKGFPPPANDDPAQRAHIQGRGLVAVFDFGKLKTPLVAKIAISPVSEANAIRNLEYGNAGMGLRCRAAGGEATVGKGACRTRRDRSGSDAHDVLHGFVSRLDRAQSRHGRGRPLPRPRQRRAHGKGLYFLFDLFAVGYLPRRASIAHADPASGRAPTISCARFSPSSRKAPMACCRSGRSRDSKPGA